MNLAYYTVRTFSTGFWVFASIFLRFRAVLTKVSNEKMM